MVLAAVFLPGLFDSPALAWSDLLAERYVDVWRNTLLLCLLVTALSLAFAVPAALLAWRSRAAGLIDFVMSVPFLTPPFLVSMAWAQSVGRRGYLAQFLGVDGLLLADWLYTLPGMALLMAVSYAPLVYFALRAQLARLNPSLLWAARLGGAGRGATLRLVLLPLLAPALLAGGFLAFASALGEYGTPLVIGQRIGFPVVATEIGRLVAVAPINLSLASALGSQLMLVGVLAYVLANRLQRSPLPLTGRSSYALPGLLGVPAAIAAWLSLAVLTVVGVMVPFLAIGVTSFLRAISRGATAGNFTLGHYVELLTPGSPGFAALVASLQLAAVAALLALIVGLVAARAGRAVVFLGTVPLAVPAIVLAVGLLRGWNAPWAAHLPVYGTPALLILYYLAQYLPFTVQYVQAGMSALPRNLESAARVHGASPFGNFRAVVAPLLLPHALGGAILVFSIAFRELVGSVLLRPAGLHTGATYILSQFDQGSLAAGMAMGVIMLLAALLSVMVTRLFARG